MELINQIYTHYTQNFDGALISLSVVALIAIFILRNPLKVLFASFLGYRASLDDYAFSEHKNRDIIYNNKVIQLNSGLTIKNALLIIIGFGGALINPFLFAIPFLKYKYDVTKEQLNKLVDYKVYEDFKSDDIFVKFLNEYSSKINLIIDELMTTAYIIMLVGMYLGSMYLALCGLFIVGVILITTFAFIYNAFMYKINYKYVEFYRIMRLLENSSLGGNKSLFVLFVISFASNFSDIQGFSIYVWVAITIKTIISLTINYILKRDDDLDEYHQQIENREYSKLHQIASYPNPKSQSRGYKFTSLLQMKFFEIDKMETDKNLLHLDNYAFYPQAINRTVLKKNPLLKDTLSNSVKVALEAFSLTKQLIILGGMGSGKTELVNYIVEQVHKSNFEMYKAITFNDEAGDFVSKFYREDKDIIVSLFDGKSSAWDIFEEMKYNIEAGTAFVNNLFDATQGKEKDFFAASAKQKTSNWLKESFYATNNSTDAWNMFFERISAYEQEIKEKDDKTQSSILATIEIALDTLNIMYYQIVVEKRKTFTFYEYVRTTNIQLFFLNNPQYEDKSIGYMTGIQAAYVIAGAAKKQHEIKDKEHLILNVFDEFLSMQERLNTTTSKILLTKIRKFLFCNILMAQYLPKDEKFIQDIDSSRYALISFNINDDYTLEKVSSKFSDAECLVANSSPEQENNNSSISTNGDDAKAGFSFVGRMVGDALKAVLSLQSKKYKLSYSLGQQKLVYNQQLQSMPEYHHITFLPTEKTKVINDFEAKRFFKLLCFGYDKLMSSIAKTDDFLSHENGILYLGYTPMSTLDFNNVSFTDWDMKGFYTFKIEKEKTDEILDEKIAFKHYLGIKFAETVENAKKYIINNRLERVNIEKLFSKVEENTEKVNTLLKKYSEEERYELMEQFFNIDENDFDTKYDFVKEHDLLGAILGIFTFSDEFREKVLQSEV